MAQKRKTDQTKSIAAAAIALAEKRGWGGVSFKDVARTAKCGTDDVTALFPDVWAIILWHLERIEERVRLDVEEHLGQDWRDNLMEIVMLRFECAQEHRAAWTSLPEAFRKKPKKLRHFLRPFYKTMRRMLALSGLPKQQINPLLTAALGGVYLSLIHVWMEDDTKDLAKTMAAIDKRIGIIETLAHYASCRLKTEGA